MKPKHLISSSIAAGMLLSAQAWSVALTAPGSYALPGTTVAANPDLAGTVLVDTLTDFTLDTGGSDTVSGTIQSRVVREDGTGTLDFYWRVTPTAGNAAISYFRVGGFGANALDANWRIDGLGNVAPTSAYYFGSSGSLAGYVNFGLDQTPLTAGNSSYFMFLHTNATSYAQNGNMDVADVGTAHDSQLLSTYAPTVPIPATAWLLGSGITGLISITRRKKIA